MYVIATAGHVDHGKSTLIRALTGMEPDRWAEERRRGMTIDLGYAWTRLDDGQQVAFVDVPGHERFVPNMLAGVGPVPAVVFVVAADAGWSAQSAEHLKVLEALGVRHGILAITRSDLGEPELAEEEARTYLDETGLAGMESVAVSAVTGEGIQDMRAALGRLVGSLSQPEPGPARMWIDRVFTVRGAGTVATGTLISGSLHVADSLEVRPSGPTVRIRGIQTLGAAVDGADAVSRVALNLRGVKVDELRRGMAVTTPGNWVDVGTVDVRLTSAARLPAQLLWHVGSAAVAVRPRALGGDTVRLALAGPLPLHVGDRGVLRDPGSRMVLAGATVLDTMPPPLRRRGAARLRAEVLARVSETPDAIEEIQRRGAVRRRDLIVAGVRATDDDVAGAVVAGDWLVSPATWWSWTAALPEAVDGWASRHPMQPGIPRQAAASAAGLPDERLVDVVAHAITGLVVDASGVHREGVEPRLPAAADTEVARLSERLESSPFAAPEAPELLAVGLTEQYLALAVRQGRLIRVGSGIYLRPDAIEEAKRRLSALPAQFTMSEARSAMETTRRVAVPFLEFLDRQGVTRRVDGEKRTLRSSLEV